MGYFNVLLLKKEMSRVRKDQLTQAKEWVKHLRNRYKRIFWKVKEVWKKYIKRR